MSLSGILRKFVSAPEKKGLAGDRFLAGYDLLSGKTGSLSREFENSPWVMRAIKFCADPIAGLDLNFSTDRRGGQVPIEDPAVRAFWERPAIGLRGMVNRGDLVRATVGWLKLEGEAFWILDDSWFDVRTPLERKSPILVARPGDIRPLCGSAGEVIGWQWIKQGAKGATETINLLPEEVVHLACWNPYDELRGLAEWKAAKMAADADYFAGNFAKLLMENNGDRGPIVTGEGAASDEQIAQITRILREKRERNKRGEFVPAFLVGSGLNVADPSVQAVDSAFVAQRLENRHEIFLAFGVPPSFAEVTVSYSVGSASDRFRLIEDTCMPLAAMIADGIEDVMNGRREGQSQLRPAVLRQPVFADFDFDEHSTMQAVRAERTESATKLVDRGVPWTVASDHLKLGLPRFQGDEVGRVPFNLQEINGTTESTEVAEEKKGGRPDQIKSLERLFERRALAKKQRLTDAEREAKEKENFERGEKWRKLHQARKPWEKQFRSKVSALLMKARSQTLEKLGVLDEKTLADRVTKNGAVDLAFDLPEWLQEFVDNLTLISRSARDAAALELWLDELGREDDPAELPAANTLRFLRQRRNMLTETATEIHEEILGTLEEGLNNGETMDELAERTRAAFNGINRTRAEAIATTETAVAYETARQETFEEAGVEFKEWLTSQDDRVRLDHWRADGEVVGINEKFTVGGELMAHPGDPEASAKQVIRCRCIAIASMGPSEG